MKIDQWKMLDVMSLPDFVFGRRWTISVHRHVEGQGTAWRMSELMFPDSCVMWSLAIFPMISASLESHIRLALGSREPVSSGEMDSLEPLVVGLGAEGAEPRKIRFSSYNSAMYVTMRNPMRVTGRRLVIEVYAPANFETRVMACVEVSCIPTEVPDWLVGHVGSGGLV